MFQQRKDTVSGEVARNQFVERVYFDGKEIEEDVKEDKEDFKGVYWTINCK